MNESTDIRRLVNILDELQIIKESYLRSGEFLLEKPTKLLLLGDEKEKLDTEISKLECQGYSDQYLDERRKMKLFQKIEGRLCIILQLPFLALYISST